jgi:hypothetical protein
MKKHGTDRRRNTSDTGALSEPVSSVRARGSVKEVWPLGISERYNISEKQ